MQFFPPNNIFFGLIKLNTTTWQQGKGKFPQILGIQSNFGACERLKLLIFLSMSYLGGLSKELQFLLKLLIPFVIVLWKGVVDPTTNGIKKEVEDIVPPVIDIKKEVVVLVSF